MHYRHSHVIAFNILPVTGQVCAGTLWLFCSSIGGRWMCSGTGLKLKVFPSTDSSPRSSWRLISYSMRTWSSSKEANVINTLLVDGSLDSRSELLESISVEWFPGIANSFWAASSSRCCVWYILSMTSRFRLSKLSTSLWSLFSISCKNDIYKIKSFSISAQCNTIIYYLLL